MARPAITFTGHYDWSVIVPDQPLHLPKDAEVSVRLEVVEAQGSPKGVALKRFDALAGSIRGIVLPTAAYDRENLYKGRLRFFSTPMSSLGIYWQMTHSTAR